VPVPHSNRPLRLWPVSGHAIPVLGLLLLVAGTPQDSCSFTAGPNGLCASLRIGPQDTVFRAGDTFRVRINASGCAGAAVCPCADTAMVGAQWKSDAPEVASVDQAGLVTGHRQGNANIVLYPTSTVGWTRTVIHVTVIP
jgi:hypothetical protein